MKTLGLTFFFLALTIQSSLACECITELTETLEQKVNIASVIFYGEVVSIADSESHNQRSQNLKGYGFEPQFRILEILKGDLDSDMKDDRFFLIQPNLSVCSDNFKVGEKYLVFANRNENGEIWLRICNPPFVFEDQKAYRAKRREIKKIR